MFGLAQLYQLRGRVGRSKLRAYSLFTLPAQQKITAHAERRLKVLQSLENLGAGFQLASHDLDIRGAGNLLGEEQSGHIKEVGFELYQSMLEEAILNLKAGVAEPAADRWSPQITVGMPVLIPEDYVADLAVRLSLYRRLADLDTDDEIDNFAAELRDRFGVLPDEVRYLFKIAAIKGYCRRANVEKVDAGPKGVVITFRDNKFAQPDRLVYFIRQHGQAAKVRPDMKVVFLQQWETPEERLAAPPKSCASSPISPRTARRRSRRWRAADYDAARRASSSSRASSEAALSAGNRVARVTTGSDRASRLPWLVWRITLDSRRAIMWALRRSVSANTTMTEPSGLMRAKIHLPHQAADDPRGVELGARLGRHRRQSAPPTIRRRSTAV